MEPISCNLGMLGNGVYQFIKTLGSLSIQIDSLPPLALTIKKTYSTAFYPSTMSCARIMIGKKLMPI